GLLIVAMVCIPPILKAFVVLPWWTGKLFFFPFFLVVPGILVQWFVGRMLNRWLIPGGAASASAYWWVGGWTLLTMTVWLLTRRRLRTLISDEELPL
ncbi:MAG: hypothetical protein JST42_16005, partial [Bacteroidetes bacterium]|nr:hypothetical protein [Bacteroidota bacterium]